MPGKAKYCEHCKGYGGLYVQTIKRYGDDRIKERTPETPIKESCKACGGTGMVSVTTDKVPVFEVEDPETTFNKELQGIKAEREAEEIEDIASVLPVMSDEEEEKDFIEKLKGEDKERLEDGEVVPSEEPEPNEDDDQQPWDKHPVVNEPEEDDVVFEPTPIDDNEEMGL